MEDTAKKNVDNVERSRDKISLAKKTKRSVFYVLKPISAAQKEIVPRERTN